MIGKKLGDQDSRDFMAKRKGIKRRFEEKDWFNFWPIWAQIYWNWQRKNSLFKISVD